jgi:heme/copper-type cytochrome/quinol oxidase subunit 2
MYGPHVHVGHSSHAFLRPVVVDGGGGETEQGKERDLRHYTSAIMSVRVAEAWTFYSHAFSSSGEDEEEHAYERNSLLLLLVIIRMIIIMLVVTVYILDQTEDFEPNRNHIIRVSIRNHTVPTNKLLL